MPALDISDTRIKILERISKLSDDQQQEILKFTDDLLDERRRSDRKTYHADVDLDNTQGPTSGMIRNISASGMYIVSQGPLGKGRQITLSFIHPAYESPIKLSGKIVWKDDEGIGVQFTERIDGL